MEAFTPTTRAEYLIKKLFFDPSKAAFLRSFAWASESDRWNELVFAALSRVCDRPEAELRELTDYLDNLGHLGVGRLAKIGIAGDAIDPADEEAGLILAILRERGIPDQQASKALLLLSQLAKGLQTHFSGKVQRYLRRYGETMLRDLSGLFPVQGMGDEDVRYVFTHWLQAASSMPVSLHTPALERYCLANGISVDDLLDAADNLNLNVAVVDDLVALEAASKADESNKSKGVIAA